MVSCLLYFTRILHGIFGSGRDLHVVDVAHTAHAHAASSHRVNNAATVSAIVDVVLGRRQLWAAALCNCRKLFIGGAGAPLSGTASLFIAESFRIPNPGSNLYPFLLFWLPTNSKIKMLPSAETANFTGLRSCCTIRRTELESRAAAPHLQTAGIPARALVRSKNTGRNPYFRLVQ